MLGKATVADLAAKSLRPAHLRYQGFAERLSVHRAAADSQSNELTEKILNEFLRTAASLLTATTSGGEAIEVQFPCRVIDCLLKSSSIAIRVQPMLFIDCKFLCAGFGSSSALCGLHLERPSRVSGLHPLHALEQDSKQSFVRTSSYITLLDSSFALLFKVHQYQDPES